MSDLARIVKSNIVRLLDEKHISRAELSPEASGPSFTVPIGIDSVTHFGCSPVVSSEVMSAIETAANSIPGCTIRTVLNHDTISERWDAVLQELGMHRIWPARD